MRMSHIVLKASDLTKALENLPKGNHDFNNILSEYSKVRKDQGKLSDHRYIVVNMDEPYVNEVIAVLEKNGHWGENPSEFTHAEIQTALQESYEDMLKVKVESQVELIDELRLCLQASVNENQKLRKALLYYGDPTIYEVFEESIIPNVIEDGGQIARNSLNNRE